MPIPEKVSCIGLVNGFLNDSFLFINIFCKNLPGFNSHLSRVKVKQSLVGDITSRASAGQQIIRICVFEFEAI
jgi:hypothetical protein